MLMRVMGFVKGLVRPLDCIAHVSLLLIRCFYRNGASDEWNRRTFAGRVDQRVIPDKFSGQDNQSAIPERLWPYFAISLTPPQFRQL
jgi:hypothetical protein